MEAFQVVAVALYQAGILTQNQASETVDMTLREFQKLILSPKKPLSGGLSDEEIESHRAAYMQLNHSG